MLSIENPPPDPPCPPQISELKSSDEKASSDKLALPEVEVEVDLLKSGLDDNNPVPKFSIRDYVFSARGKDIKGNWPFSDKNLELCLKHGVKDLLPPFQPLDSVRNQSVKRCGVFSDSLDKENLSKRHGKPSGKSNQLALVSSDGAKCNQKLTLESVNINSSGATQGEKEFQSQAEGNSGADTLLKPLTETGRFAVPRETHKMESKTQTPVKRCRLIVKLSNLADPSMKEDSIPSNFLVSEAMASKVCPVCKTFSSSSNTTLNAHIDQCLSGESTMKRSSNSKVIKHRIKPRKTRSMVDIYETASYCTLEELDRRNGTNWASNSMLLIQDTELCAPERAQESVQRVSTIALEDTGREGAVYIDTDGTKVRILSKFNDISGSKVGDDPGPLRLLKGNKVSKFLAIKKRKKHHVQKHQKFLKLAPHGKKCCSPKSIPNFETPGGQERNFVMEQSGEKEELVAQALKVQDRVEPLDSGIIRRWVCSKRTVLAKKNCNQDDRNPLKDLLAGSEQLHLGDSHVERSCPPKHLRSSENQISSPESNKRMEISSCQPGISISRETSHLDNRVELLGSRIGGFGKRSLSPNQKSRKEDSFVHARFKDSPNCTATSSKKGVEMIAGPAKSADASVVGSKPSSSRQTFSSKATRFSSMREKLLSLTRSCKSDVKRKCSELKRSQVHCASKLDKDLSVWPSQTADQLLYSRQDHAVKQSQMEDISGKTDVSRPITFKFKKKRGATKVSRKEEAVGLKSSILAPHSYGHGMRVNMDSSVNLSCALEGTLDNEMSVRDKVIGLGEPIANESASRIAVEGSLMSSSKYLDPVLNELPCSTAQRKSEQCAEVNEDRLCGGPEGSMCPNDPSLSDKQDLFSADEVGHFMIGEGSHMVAELDSKDEQGNYFSEVDPIPIPGPPGSFLPSPGHMGSEDYQGNSSLTISQVQSMEDHHDLVDRDLSNSPISATSTISNPTLAISDSRSSEMFSVGPPSTQCDTRQVCSSAGVDPVVENFAQVPQVVNFGAERDAMNVNANFPEKGPFNFKNEQLCCCSRKEGASLGVSLNYQDSQLLRRRTMALVSLPGKQMNGDPNKRLSSLNLRSEILSFSNIQSSGPETAAQLSSMKLAAGQIPMKSFAEREAKFPIRGDHDSAASPSASNPVLRLMGKNLMVDKKDEDVYLQLKQHQVSSNSDHTNFQPCTFSGGSPGNAPNEQYYHSFHQVAPQGRPIFVQDRHSAISQHFDARLSDNFINHVDMKTPSTPFHASGTIFPSLNAANSFKTFQERNEYKGGSNFLTEEHRPKNRLDKPLTYDIEKTVANPGPQRRNSSSAMSSVKEIIVIDDTPENDDAIYNNGSMRSGPIPRVSEYSSSSRQVNPFYSNQLEGGGSQYGSFQMPPSGGGVNGNPVKWNCNPEGASRLQYSSSFVASSTNPGGHLRPTFYYSPSFS